MAAPLFVGIVSVVLFGRSILLSLLDQDDDSWVVALGWSIVLFGWVYEVNWVLITGVAVAAVGEFNHQTRVVGIGRQGREPVRTGKRRP